MVSSYPAAARAEESPFLVLYPECAVRLIPEFAEDVPVVIALRVCSEIHLVRFPVLNLDEFHPITVGQGGESIKSDYWYSCPLYCLCHVFSPVVSICRCDFASLRVVLLTRVVLALFGRRRVVFWCGCGLVLCRGLGFSHRTLSRILVPLS